SRTPSPTIGAARSTPFSRRRSSSEPGEAPPTRPWVALRGRTAGLFTLSGTMKATDHILIVDDDREIRELTAGYLRKQLLQVSVASNGEEMRRVLEADDVDLVVLDVLLPNEDGFALCRHLHS